MILKHRLRLLTRAGLTGIGREVALDVIRRWADGQPQKSSACGLYGAPPRRTRHHIDPSA